MKSSSEQANTLNKIEPEHMVKAGDFNSSKLLVDLKTLYLRLYGLYSNLLNNNHIGYEEVKLFLDNVHSEYDISLKEQEDWDRGFCRKAAYLTLNKVLLIRICEDMGFTRMSGERYFHMAIEDSLEELLHVLVASRVTLERGYRKDWYTEFTKVCSKFVSMGVIEVYRDLISTKYDFKNAIELHVLGSVYESFNDPDIRKSLGQYYTPIFVIDYILENTVRKIDVVENPLVKVLDPACGSGHFLISAYDILKEKFLQNLNALRNRYADESYTLHGTGGTFTLKGREYWQESNIHFHVIKHCLYGADIDDFAIQLTTINLLLKDPGRIMDNFNLVCCDSLVQWERDGNEDSKTEGRFWKNRFDYVIGNPPYIGHKKLSMNYKKWLFENYRPVFNDKSDISYCFFYRALQVMKDKSVCSFITSRYFMESPTGRNLRSYLKNNSTVQEIVDFYGAEVFKEAGVAAAIFTITKNTGEEGHPVRVLKLKDDKLNNRIDLQDFDVFDIDENMMTDDRWLLLPEWKYSIYRKIEAGCSTSLDDIALSFQGIITGCDRAFVMEEDQAAGLNIENNLLYPWIKNSNVQRYRVGDSSKYIIYSDLIDSEDKYPNSIRHISIYKDRLEGRRECKKGVRKWHQLQWGRDIALFLNEKMVFPYKSDHNRFAIDRGANLCSADVYSFKLKENISGFTLEYLCGVLNSRIYEFYFKLFAKKMGSGIYDYYPNSVMQLKIPDMDMCQEIENKVREIMDLLVRQGDDNSNAEPDIKKCEKEIDNILANAFRLTKEEAELIYGEA